MVAGQQLILLPNAAAGRGRWRPFSKLRQWLQLLRPSSVWPGHVLPLVYWPSLLPPPWGVRSCIVGALGQQ